MKNKTEQILKTLIKRIDPFIGLDYIILRNNVRSLYTRPMRKRFVEREYLKRTGTVLDWNNLETYTQKMQFDKMNNIYPEKVSCSDKLLVRDFIKRRIGEEYLIPILGVWDKVEDISFESLPKEYVLKTTHGSGTVYVVNDKDKIDKRYIKRLFKRWLKLKYQYSHFEMHYSGIIPRIYAEKKLHFSDGIEDYKFLCFNGEPYYCWIDFDRFTKHKRNVYDMEWNLQDWNQYTYGNSAFPVAKPEKFELMKAIAAKLSKGFPHVRIDLYNCEDGIYVGEMTFTNGAGIEKITSYSADLALGELWNLDTNTGDNAISKRSQTNQK